MARGPQQRDLGAVLVIGAGFILAWLLLPIAHNFAILDDWAYARAVEKMAAGQGFAPVEVAQATLVTQAGWGLLFVRLLGPGFTTLTAATMALSLGAALTFYALLRRLDYGPGLSLLGVAVLALNPYYLNLSYSFMTEIPFLALLLLSVLLTLLGFQGRGMGWLWAGSAAAALAFLTRQFGLAVPLAAAVWLIAARQARPRTLAAVGLLPALAVLGYTLWSSGFAPTFSGSVGREEILALLRGPGAWVQRAAHFVYLAAFLPGLTIPLWSRVRRWPLVAGLAGLTAAAVFVLWRVKVGLVAQGQSTLDDLSYSWLQPAIHDPTWVYCLGAALTVWLVAGIVQRGGPGFVARLRRRSAPAPADFLAWLAGILLVGTFVVNAGFLDRYWLPILPLIVAGALLPFRERSVRALIPALLAGVVLAGYAALLHLDQYDSVGAAWAAGRGLVARGVPYEQIANDYSWEGYFLYDEALARLPNHDIAAVGRVFPPQQIIDPLYVVDSAPRTGYHVVARYPYLERLSGWTQRDMLVLQRDQPGN